MTAVPRSRRLARVLATATVAAAALNVSASTSAVAAPTPAPTPAPGSAARQPDQPRATFGIRPADRQDPRRPNKLGPGDRRGFLLFNGTPGGAFTDYVAIANYGLVPLRIRVYATDAFNDKAGGFALLDSRQRPSDAGTWLSVGTPGGSGFVTVAPRSRVVLPVKAKVPAQASPGDHVAGVVASYVSQGRTPGQPNVTLDQRVGARAYFRVSGPLRPQLSVQNLKAVYHGGLGLSGRTTVTWTLRNTGNVKLGATQKVRLTGPFGRTGRVAGRVDDINVLLPGNAAQESVEVTGVRPEGLMKATVQVVPGVPTTDVDPRVEPTSASVTFLALPWLLVLLLALLLLLGLGLRRLRARRRTASASGAGTHRRRKGARGLAPGSAA